MSFFENNDSNLVDELEDKTVHDLFDSLDDIIVNNIKQTNILVYCLKYFIINNKILNLTDKIKEDNFEFNNFDIFHKFEINNNLDLINNELDINEYGYIFSEKKITNHKYVLKTYFNLNKKIILEPYRYYKPKLIDKYCINTKLNLDMNKFYIIPDEIYKNKINFKSSRIIWSPSMNNIDNEHFLIRKINEIGCTLYKRKTNLINVVSSNDENKINEFSDCIKNTNNICIYQETASNPLNMKNCVYMQWFYDVFCNISKYDDKALFLYQFPMYSCSSNILRNRYNVPIDINCINIYPNCLPLIFNIHVITDIMNNNNIEKTIESCYLLRKTKDTHPLKMMDRVSDFYIHNEESISIDSYNLQENIEIFLKCKKIYCYDNVCFLPVLAAACGCIPVLINKYPGFENIRELYKIYSPWMYYGMAYDDTEEAIQFAKDTKHLLLETIKKIDSDNYLNFFSNNGGNLKILNFLKYLECYFGVSFSE
jgi:hypothetical protein